MEVKEAVETLVKALKEDPGLHVAWKANIAMAFYDQSRWDNRKWSRKATHDTANKAADYFLRLLCTDTK